MSQAQPRVLIVGTIPYNPNTSSRAFDAYFNGWDRGNLRQIFSNTKTPTKGHCSSLYQITDQRLLKRRFGKIKEVGVIYNYEELPEVWEDSSNLEVNSKVTEKLYRLGSKDSALKHLLRKALWKRKYWNTEKLRTWLDEFNPECVFLAFSDDFFIPEIAMFVADRFNIPIMSCIGDDYFFNDKKTISPLYHIYRKKYKKCIRKVFSHKSSAIYISDKIRDKYNKEFNINGDTVYLTSDIQRREFKPINKKNPLISYCGNVRLGRNTSLVDIANALNTINSEYKLHVYSGEKNEEFITPLKDCNSIVYHGTVPYEEVMNVTKASDISVVVEGFKKKEVNITRYSLSTKVADAISSGCQILGYGDKDCGAIEYLQSVKCAVVCTDRAELATSINSLIENVDYQQKLYAQSEVILKEHHNKEISLKTSLRLFNELVYGEIKDE